MLCFPSHWKVCCAWLASCLSLQRHLISSLATPVLEAVVTYPSWLTLMFSDRRGTSVPCLLGRWLPHPGQRVRRGFLMHAAASLDNLSHFNAARNVSCLR